MKMIRKLSDALRPFTFLSQLLGVTFFDHFLVKRFRVIVTYRVMVLTILALALVHEIPAVLFWSRNLTGIHRMLAFIETRLRWLAVILNFLLTIFSNKKINNVIDSLLNSPLTLKQKEYVKIFRFQLYILTSTFLIITLYNVLGHDFLWLNMYYKWYTSTIYIITEFYIGYGNLQFVILLYVIKKYFNALNENLMKSEIKPENPEREIFIFSVAKAYKQDKISEMVNFRQIHMNLTNACWKANQCYSLQILVFLVVSLVEVTYSLRSVTVYSIGKDPQADTYNQWKSKPFLELGLIACWGGYYIWSILQIIIACEQSVVEANKTASVVHDLINKVEDKDLEKQLQLFSLQLMNHNVFFSAGKFVTLNYSLLNSIIGTITTYLVIIITFS